MVLSFFMGEFPRIRRGALPVRRSSVPPCDITGIGPCRSGPWPRAFCRGGLREALGHGPLLQGASGLWRAVAAEAARRAREHHRTLRAVLAHRRPAEAVIVDHRSEEHTSELQSLMRISYAVFCLKK